jgi:hypothetical protein
MITLLFGMILFAGQGMAMDPKKSKVVGHWTQERMNQAIPRDLVIDPRGLGYLRMPDGSFQPHGHQIAVEQGASRRQPQGKPSGNADTTPPDISNMDPAPASGDTIGTSHTFAATVIDEESGVKSVTFTLRYPDNTTTQSFSANQGSNNVWTVNLQGFSAGDWSWQVTAKDRGSKGGNTKTSNWVGFSVGSGGGGGDTGDTIINSEWLSGGAVQTALGRIYFQMPKNSRWNGPWQGYVCSGTVVTDTAGTRRSIILTAAHCVYDDAHKAFARNVLFIPNQAGTLDFGGTGTDLNCDNDPLGCWVPSFGVVDTDWTTRVFPNNIEWDYAYYIVNDSSAHTGMGAGDVLDLAAGSLAIQFDLPFYNDGTDGSGSADFTHALGYSYDQDPKLMYCAEDMTTEGAVNWWLPNCDLSGGSSGGTWVQPMNEITGIGPVISVNSWGYTTSSGMAGPKLNNGASTASCLFDEAETKAFEAVSSADGNEGVKVTCSP